MSQTNYKEKIKRLSQRIVDAQRPIRILEAIKWDPHVESNLKKSKFREMPKIGPKFYQNMDLGYRFDAKIGEFAEIVQDIKLTLGGEDSLGVLLVKIAEEYQKCCSYA